MKLREHLRSGTVLPVPADADIADQQDDAAQIAPQFVNERVIERVLGVPLKTLRNWRVSGRGPPFNKFGATVRYELAAAIRWARDRQVNSTSEIALMRLHNETSKRPRGGVSANAPTRDDPPAQDPAHQENQAGATSRRAKRSPAASLADRR